jgi:hypothetical protein
MSHAFADSSFKIILTFNAKFMQLAVFFGKHRKVKTHKFFHVMLRNHTLMDCYFKFIRFMLCIIAKRLILVIYLPVSM